MPSRGMMSSVAGPETGATSLSDSGPWFSSSVIKVSARSIERRKGKAEGKNMPPRSRVRHGYLPAELPAPHS